MQTVASMQDSDFEHSEVVDAPEGRGRALRIFVSKVGGGTVGRSYDGMWLYRVRAVGGGPVLIEDCDLRTGTPKTHQQALRIVEDALETILDPDYRVL